MAGENIAAGQTSASAAFTAWKEEDEYYSGQGHRRSMLSAEYNYTAIGIGCVKYNGYYYWVQEFSGKTINSTSTSANDSSTTVSAYVADDQVSCTSLSASPSSYTMQIGDSASLPTITGSITLSGTWPSGKTCSLSGVDADWSSSDSSIASVADGKVTGVKSGSTALKASALGESFSVPVSVAYINDATITPSKTSYTYDESAKNQVLP